MPTEGIKVDMPTGGIKVDMPTEGIKVDMPTEMIKVTVDMGDAASRLNASISAALSKPIRVEVSGGVQAVGGEKVDALATCVRGLEDRLLYVKNDLESKISVIETKPMGEEKLNFLKGHIKELETKLAFVKSDLDLKINSVDSKSVGKEKLVVLEGYVRELGNKLMTVNAALNSKASATDTIGLSAYIERLANRMTSIKAVLEGKINSVDLKASNSVDPKLDLKVNALIRSQVSEIERQLVIVRGNSVDTAGAVSGINTKFSHLLDDLERRLSVVFNMAPT